MNSPGSNLFKSKGLVPVVKTDVPAPWRRIQIEWNKPRAGLIMELWPRERLGPANESNLNKLETVVVERGPGCDGVHGRPM